MRLAASDARMRGEMVIRSGTDEAEARALAESLHAVGANVRPARHGNITIYEVVMGLSG
jgi:UDP-N-acetylglucosamine enolpyruvyl transferase